MCVPVHMHVCGFAGWEGGDRGREGECMLGDT